METKYPSIIKRVAASFVDVIFVFLLTYFVSRFLPTGIESDSTAWRPLILLMTFFIYDPLFTSLFGGTIGHMFLDLRVKNYDETKNISFVQAIFRFVLKYFLGWVSLITVHSEVKRRAIHDKAVNSVVIEVK